MKILIERGANINLQDNEGKTALSVSAEFGDTKLAKLLIENGANVNLAD
jgi:uncharacterized protein